MRFVGLVGLLVLVAGTLPAVASIVNIEPSASGPVVLRPGSGFDGDETITLLERVSGTNALVTCDVVTDPPGTDPYVWVRKGVENDTDFAWGSYLIDIASPQQFSVAALQPMADWTAIASPVVQLPDGKWGTTVQFQAGPHGQLVGVGQEGEFDIRLWLPVAVQFCVNQTPMAPEPASVALLAIGGLLTRRGRRP